MVRENFWRVRSCCSRLGGICAIVGGKLFLKSYYSCPTRLPLLAFDEMNTSISMVALAECLNTEGRCCGSGLVPFVLIGTLAKIELFRARSWAGPGGQPQSTATKPAMHVKFPNRWDSNLSRQDTGTALSPGDFQRLLLERGKQDDSGKDPQMREGEEPLTP